MTEQNLHDYNKWLMEVWNPNQLYIPFAIDAPKAFLDYQAEQLNLTNVVERLPIGEIIKLIDNEYFKGFTGELKITGHCSYMGKKVGHLVNGEGIFLIEDFVR